MQTLTRPTVENRVRAHNTTDAMLAIGACTVSVIIPTLNEAENLRHVLPLLPKHLHEVIIVDGRSTDNTIEVAKALIPDVKIVLQTGKGKGNALCAGFAAATGDIIVHLDADGSTDPHEIPVFVGALLSGAAVASGKCAGQGFALHAGWRHVRHDLVPQARQLGFDDGRPRALRR